MPDLKAFDRPVRIIFGAKDPYLNTGVARSLHEALPTSDLWLLSEKGHWPQMDGARRWHSSCTLCQKLRERLQSPHQKTYCEPPQAVRSPEKL